MKRSAQGEQLWKDMRVTVCLPGQKDIVWRHHTEPGKGWRAEDLEAMLAKVADSVEQKYPTIEFRLVELAANNYKFVYRGKRETMAKEIYEATGAPSLNGCPIIARSSDIAARARR